MLPAVLPSPKSYLYSNLAPGAQIKFPSLVRLSFTILVRAISKGFALLGLRSQPRDGLPHSTMSDWLETQARPFGTHFWRRKILGGTDTSDLPEPVDDKL